MSKSARIRLGHVCNCNNRDRYINIHDDTCSLTASKPKAYLIDSIEFYTLKSRQLEDRDKLCSGAVTFVSRSSFDLDLTEIAILLTLGFVTGLLIVMVYITWYVL